MKNANGTGSVCKVKDGRRKPWKVTITAGFSYDPEAEKATQRRKVLGYYPTRTEAQDALSNYRQNPYDIDSKKVTFAEMYEKWSGRHYGRISASLQRVYKSAYNQAEPLHAMKFADIRPYHIETAMGQCKNGSASKNNIKQLCNLIFKYAIKNELATTNYAAMCDGVSNDSPTIIRSPFTADEEQALWDNRDFPFVEMVLVGLYSGWRPQELAILKTSDVNLDDMVFTGGIKTKAGKGRAVPIHSKIREMVESQYRKAMDAKSTGLYFRNERMPLTYGTYKIRYDKIRERLGFTHAPHDVRHTFVTKGKEAGMDEYILKLIIGHAISDLTEKVYTHRKMEELRVEIEKIH